MASFIPQKMVLATVFFHNETFLQNTTIVQSWNVQFKGV